MIGIGKLIKFFVNWFEYGMRVIKVEKLKSDLLGCRIDWEIEKVVGVRDGMFVVLLFVFGFLSWL